MIGFITMQIAAMNNIRGQQLGAISGSKQVNVVATGVASDHNFPAVRDAISTASYVSRGSERGAVAIMAGSGSGSVFGMRIVGISSTQPGKIFNRNGEPIHVEGIQPKLQLHPLVQSVVDGDTVLRNRPTGTPSMAIGPDNAKTLSSVEYDLEDGINFLGAIPKHPDKTQLLITRAARILGRVSDAVSTASAAPSSDTVAATQLKGIHSSIAEAIKKATAIPPVYSSARDDAVASLRALRHFNENTDIIGKPASD